MKNSLRKKISKILSKYNTTRLRVGLVPQSKNFDEQMALKEIVKAFDDEFSKKNPQTMLTQGENNEKYHLKHMTEMVESGEPFFNPEFAALTCGNSFVEGWEAARQYYLGK